MSAVREFNINESMVRKWKKQEHDLLQVKKTKQFPSEQSEMATIMVQIKWKYVNLFIAIAAYSL